MATEVPLDDLPDEVTSREVPADDLPEPAQQASGILPTIARVGGGLAGAGIGSIVPVVGTLAGGAIGSGLGEGIAQLLEGKFKPAQIPLALALGLIPAAKVPGVTSTLGKIGVRAAEGAVMGAGSEVASKAVEGELPSWGDVGTAAGVGTVLGTAFGGVEAGAAKRGLSARSVPTDDLPPAAIKAAEVQGGLFDEATLAKTADPRIEKIAALEANNARLKDWTSLKKGEQPSLFEQPGQTPDPIYHKEGPPQLEERQLRKLNMLLRNQPDQAGAYLENILNQHQNATPTRSVEVGARMLGVPSERGKLAKAFDVLTSDPTLPDKPTDIGLFLRKLGTESSGMVERFGPYGKRLTDMVRTTYDNFEKQLSQYLDGPQGVLHVANTLKLTPKERENISNVMEGFEVAMNPRVEKVVGMMQLQREAIAKRAAQTLEIRNPKTGEVEPWNPRENYMPHFVDFDKVAKDPSRLAKVLQEIQLQESKKAGHPVSAAEAQNIFNQMRRNSRQEYGHLEVARQFDLSDYDKDGIATWARYVEGSLKRMNEAEVFKPKGENIVAAIQGIGMTAGDDAAQAATRYITQVTGRDPVNGFNAIDANAGKLFNFVRSMQVGLKLGQAVIANMSQSNMTGMVTGYQNLYKGFRELQTSHGKDFARLGGATIEQTMRDMNEALGVGKFGGAVLKYTGFNKVELFNRMLAANSGKMFARDLVEKLQTATGPAAETYKRHLRKMGIEPTDVIKRGYRMTQDEEINAARSIIGRTQFKVRPQELPLYWNGPLGKLVTQFSSFGFKAGKAIKDEVWGEFKQGNYAPFARFLLVTPLVGEAIADIQSVAKGKERPENMAARIAENYAAVGTFGLFYDAFRSAQYGEVGVLRRLAGPTISDAAGLAAGAVGGNPKMLGKMAAQSVPVVGPTLRRALFPPQGEE